MGTKRLVLAEAPFDADQLELRRGGCGHPGPWPNAFQHCPECGTALGEPDGVGIGRGPDRAGRVSAEDSREEVVPAGGSPCFVVSGWPEHLWAYDGRSGWLRVRREADGAWVDLRRLAAGGLPGWSWAAANPDRDGFVLPTEAGPVSVRAAVDAPLRVAEGGGGRCLGGAAAPGGGTAAVPVRAAEGVALAVCGAGGEWREMPVADGGGLGGTVFAAPAVHDGDAFWCGVRGVLAASSGTDGVRAAFRAWEDGVVPVLGTRPVLTPDGRLFQLVREGGEALAFRELALPPRNGERRAVGSLWLSSGAAVFTGNRRRRLPWDAEEGWGRGRAEYPLRDGAFVLPVLALDAERFILAGVPGRATLGRFLDVAGGDGGEVRNCELFFSGATRSAEVLRNGVRVRDPSDLAAFVFRDRVFVHERNSNRCWSWALAPAAAA